jgi:hypothetical protein
MVQTTATPPCVSLWQVLDQFTRTQQNNVLHAVPDVLHVLVMGMGNAILENATLDLFMIHLQHPANHAPHPANLVPLTGQTNAIRDNV